MIDTVLRTLSILHPSRPVEIRILTSSMAVRRFTEHQRAAAWALSVPDAKAVYVTLNAFDEVAGAGVTDAEVSRRHWLLIDLDGDRPTDTNASAAELQDSRKVLDKIHHYLYTFGWSDPIVACSGNGWHLLYAIDLPNDEPSRDLLKLILAHLGQTFDTPACHIDRAVFNASRITKLYGTMVRKGPETEDRPHRESFLDIVPNPIHVTPLEKLQKLVEHVEIKPPAAEGHAVKGLYDLKSILSKLTIFATQRKGDVTIYQIRCPWWETHTGGAENGTIFTWGDDGAAGFKCQHSHCVDRDWKAFKDILQIKSKVLVLDPNAPLVTAKEFVKRHAMVDDVLSMHHQAGVFYTYGNGAYADRDEAAVRADLYRFLEPAKRRSMVENTGEEGPKKIPGLVPFDPSKPKVENVIDALRAVCNLPTSQQAPRWLKTPTIDLDPLDMLACPNGLLHIPTRTIYPPSPHFFTLNGLEFFYDPHAPSPLLWLAFLQSLWPDDPQSIDTVQEIFGYMLTPDTRFQKIFLEVGPMRSGKGVKGRILKQLVGERNVCHPTLAAFGRDFGKQVLVGKTLAIVSDARISGKTDTAAVAETLLSISGEDSQTVERKYLPDWNGKLNTRFLMLTNELPRITDVSGALASRFIVLHLRQSFLGREDQTLFDRLCAELPGILLWALDGRDRLYARGHFVQPQSSTDLVKEFEDIGSPEATFLKQCTVSASGLSVAQRVLFESWRTWCGENGRDHPGTVQSFARNVRAVMPWLGTRMHGGAGQQERHWEGIGMRDVWAHSRSADVEM